MDIIRKSLRMDTKNDSWTKPFSILYGGTLPILRPTVFAVEVFHACFKSAPRLPIKRTDQHSFPVGHPGSETCS